MSSSTSRFDTIPKPQASQWWLAVLTLSVLVLAVAGTIGLVDPYNSQVLASRVQFDRWETFRRSNVALWSAFEIEQDRLERQNPAEILLLGDSRMQQWTGGLYASRSAVVRGKNVYNLSFGGASLFEQIDFFNLYRDRFPAAKTLVIGIPYTRMIPREAGANRAEISYWSAKFPILYLTDLNEFVRSVRWLSDGMSTVGMLPRTQPMRSPRHATQNPICVNGNVISEKQLASIRGQVVSVDNRAAIGIAKDNLSKFLASPSVKGLQVYFVIPPWPPQVRHMLEGTFANRFARFRQELSSLAPVFEVRNEFADAAGWIDVEHVCPLSGEQLLDIFLEWQSL